MNRRKLFFLLSLLLLLYMSFSAALAEEAQNLAPELKYRAPGSKNISRLYDGDYKGGFQSGKKQKKFLEITSPKAIHQLYIRWIDLPSKWAIQVKEGERWESILEREGNLYYSELVELPELKHFRIVSLDKNLVNLTIYELEAYAEGELPAHVQSWQNDECKKDIMLLSAHPDDELLFFGGLIPTYGRDPKKELQVVYMTYGIRLRIYELLSGLWHCGLKNYPSIGRFPDAYSINQDIVIAAWRKKKALRYLVDEIRRHRPEVLVTHDANGEYGHGAHKACATLANLAFDLAADASYKTDYEPWQVKKLYLHLGKEKQIHMDWQQPSPVFDGKTSLDVAAEAFGHHRSQQKGSASFQGQRFLFRVVPGGMFDNSAFSLHRTMVGEDVEKNDFFENIE